MMARLAVALAATAALVWPRAADAFRPVPDDVAERLSGDGVVLRTHRDVVWDRTPTPARAAWQAFRDANPGQWRASWDAATNVPSRVFGAGIPAPGSTESARAAEQTAWRVLTEHLDLFAPGGEPRDFVVVSNELHGDLRTVGLAQHHGGLPVVGGQLSFRFRNDRLFVIGSEALPHVRVEQAGPTMPASAARRAAVDISRARVPQAGDLIAGEAEGPVILPLVGPRGVHGYRLAMGVDIEGSAAGQRWLVYVDATTGELLVREPRTHHTTATIHFDTPVRHPGGAREAYPARRARVTVNGRTGETSDSGLIVWFGDGDTAQLVLRPEGTFVELRNVAGSLAEQSTSLTTGASFTWDHSDEELIDAQLTAFVHTQLAADRARLVTSHEAWLEDEVEVNVNIDNTCNAYFDQTAKSINFFRRSEDCANTARLPDVIYHEFGHLLHVQSILPGVGQFDGAFSEGASDYFAAIITGDPGVGRGFFHNNSPLRHISPEDEEPRRWPDDISDVHSTGLIFAGAMWKLKTALIEKHGPQRGRALADRLFYAALQRATDIPSTYVEILAEDDEDGDLSTGTPNICEINRAFGMHGLRVLRAEIDDVGRDQRPSDEAHRVGFRVYGIYDQCESDRIEDADIVWRLRGGSEEHRVAMVPEGDGFVGEIPPQPHDTAIRYRFEITFADTSAMRIPRNPADPELDLYVGEVVPLYCTDFEENPFREGGWSRGALRGTNDWEWGPPGGNAGDPPFAHTGENVIGTALDGAYTSDSINFVRSPVIEVGDFTNVRLQYRRWLTVEDGHFDTASILANDQLVWRNADSEQGLSSRVHHRDEEWRFHDVPLLPVMTSDTLQLTFQLDTDPGLEFGGWNVDALCVVADPDSVCGDGVVTGFEACDDGDANSDTEPDACRTNCLPARCGDGVVNSGEECDPASDDDVPCTDTCRIARSPGQCHCQASAAAGPLAAHILLALLLSFAWRRRPRRST
jgi:hypothetical protein